MARNFATPQCVVVSVGIWGETVSEGPLQNGSPKGGTMEASVCRRRVLTIPLALLTLLSLAAARPEEQKKKQLEIKTSEGSFKASGDPDPSHLGLPVYPGSKLQKGDDEGGLDV